MWRVHNEISDLWLQALSTVWDTVEIWDTWTIRRNIWDTISICPPFNLIGGETIETSQRSPSGCFTPDLTQVDDAGPCPETLTARASLCCWIERPRIAASVRNISVFTDASVCSLLNSSRLIISLIFWPRIVHLNKKRLFDWHLSDQHSFVFMWHLEVDLSEISVVTKKGKKI